MNTQGTVHQLHPAGFTRINIGESDDRDLSEIAPEEGLKVYVTHVVRNFLSTYNDAEPKQPFLQWLCDDNNVMMLLPDSRDTFATKLAELLGITLFTIQMEEMRRMAVDVILAIGRANRIDLGDVNVGFFMPEAPALSFSQAA